MDTFIQFIKGDIANIFLQYFEGSVLSLGLFLLITIGSLNFVDFRKKFFIAILFSSIGWIIVLLMDYDQYVEGAEEVWEKLCSKICFWRKNL